jgi:predicted MFS family arabinose efflux permease
MPFIPVLLRTRLDAGTQVIGAITALTNLGVTLGCLAAPYIEKRLGIMRAISLSILLAAPLVLIVGTSPVLVIVAVAVIFREALPQTTAPLRQKFSMEVVTHRERSIMASLEQLFWQAPWALGAWLGGRLIGVYGYATVFAGAALCYALSGVSYAVLFGRESAKLKEGVELGQPVG